MATPEEIADLFDKLATERRALLETLDDVSDAEASRQPPEGDGEAGWSVKQQLVHLATMDGTYREWVRRALAEERPNVSDGRTPSTPLDIPFERANEAALPDLVAQMDHERATTLDLMRTLEPEQYERTALQQTFGELTVLQWLRSYYRHDRMHRAQIRGEESEYQPRYAPGESEPRG